MNYTVETVIVPLHILYHLLGKNLIYNLEDKYCVSGGFYEKLFYCNEIIN